MPLTLTLPSSERLHVMPVESPNWSVGVKLNVMSSVLNDLLSVGRLSVIDGRASQQINEAGQVGPGVPLGSVQFTVQLYWLCLEVCYSKVVFQPVSYCRVCNINRIIQHKGAVGNIS